MSNDISWTQQPLMVTAYKYTDNFLQIFKRAKKTRQNNPSQLASDPPTPAPYFPLIEAVQLIHLTYFS